MFDDTGPGSLPSHRVCWSPLRRVISPRRAPEPGAARQASAHRALGAPYRHRWYQTAAASQRRRLEDFLDRCHAAGQTRPTPLVLRYGEGDYNCLHQDLYGEHAFPLQVMVALSQLDKDYTGGEFLLVENLPRAQSRGTAVTLDQGQAVIWPTRYRPGSGTRGYHRITMRHGVSVLRSGRRHALGVIFHDAA
ncbi:MAG: 2OG-Fe(II) oxygenase [Pseudonocardiaceae bacterium]